MKKLCYALFLLLSALYAEPAQAQSMALGQLLKLGALPAGLPLQKMTAAFFTPDWSYGGHVDNTEEVYWSANATNYDYDVETEKATSWVSLRPMPAGTVDVLFKTSAARNFEPIRKDLKRLKLPVTPVTCLECAGERYEAPTYTLTLYSGKKGQYPFIAVLHQKPLDTAPARVVQLALPPPDAAPADSTSTNAVPSSNLIGAKTTP